MNNIPFSNHMLHILNISHVFKHDSHRGPRKAKGGADTLPVKKSGGKKK